MTFNILPEKQLAGVELLGHPLEVAFRLEPQPHGWDLIVRRHGEQKCVSFRGATAKREALEFWAFCCAELARDLEQWKRRGAPDKIRLMLPGRV